MSANKLCSGVYHNICTVLDRADKVGGTERVVDNQGDVVLVGHLGNSLDVRHVGVGVAEGFRIHRLGVGLDGSLQCGEVVHLHDGVGDT